MYTKQLKSALACAALLLFFHPVKAQGWVTNGSNRLFPVSSSLSTTGVQIGIGTRTPTAQFHTTGPLRFANLTNNSTMMRLLVTDTSGNVYFRDVASIGSGAGVSGWSKTGDAGTVPGTQFLGTTDNQRLVFKTNNVEQMTLLPNGNLGLGTSNPAFKVHIHSTTPNMKLAVSGNAPALRLWGPTESNPIYSAVLGLATATTNYATTAKPGDLVLGPLTANALIFNTNINNYTGGLDEKMRIEPNGNVGINASVPSAKLHVNGTVRLENLPQGTGNALVVDANGNVFVRTTTATSSIQSNEVQTLKSELAQLRAELEQLKGMMRAGNNTNTHTKGQLSVNVPNPFSSETTINYTLPETGNAKLQVSDVNGKLVKSFNLDNQLSGQVVVSGISKGGTYVYSLVSNGRVLDSKKMTVVK